MKQTVKGADKLIKKLKELPNKIANQILRTELRAGTKEIAAAIKEKTPVGDTGVLKRSIKVRAAGRRKGRIGFIAQITKGKDGAFYGGFTDEGTTHQQAQQFVEDGFDERAPSLAKEIPAKIAAGIRKSAKG